MTDVSDTGFDSYPAHMVSVVNTLTGLLNQVSQLAGQLGSGAPSAIAYAQLGTPVATASAVMQSHLDSTLQSTLRLLQQITTNVNQAVALYRALDQRSADRCAGTTRTIQPVTNSGTIAI
jgi:hypothetical protein